MFPLAISTVLGIVIAVVAVLVVLFFIGGLLAVRSRSRKEAGSYARHLAEADAMLEQARAADKGWHPDTMEAAAKAALEQSRPGWGYEDLHLIFVDDRPGTTEDRAHYVAIAPDGESRVILMRQGGGDEWVAERVE